MAPGMSKIQKWLGLADFETVFSPTKQDRTMKRKVPLDPPWKTDLENTLKILVINYENFGLDPPLGGTLGQKIFFWFLGSGYHPKTFCQLRPPPPLNGPKVIKEGAISG